MLAALRAPHRVLPVFLFVACLFLSASCAGFPGMTTNVSRDPRVAAYMREQRSLTKSADLDGTGVLAAGTRVELARIDRIQGDGFVLFRAKGRAFPANHPQGLLFCYEWGHGGISPQAPWEIPGDRLKKRLGLE